MARKRLIRKYGDTFVIKLIPQDMKDLGFEEGDEVDIDDFKLKKQNKK